MNDTTRGVLTAVLLVGVGFGLGWTARTDRTGHRTERSKGAVLSADTVNIKPPGTEPVMELRVVRVRHFDGTVEDAGYKEQDSGTWGLTLFVDGRQTVYLLQSPTVTGSR